MRQDVTIVFGPGDDVEVPLHVGDPKLSADEGRNWLDEAFLANDCEPLRASGKVLTKDKLLALAASVGRPRFEQDPAFREAYARAAVAALGRPVVRVDVAGMEVVC